MPLSAEPQLEEAEVDARADEGATQDGAGDGSHDGSPLRGMVDQRHIDVTYGQHLAAVLGSALPSEGSAMNERPRT